MSVTEGGLFRDEDINGALCITPSPHPFQVVRQATHIFRVSPKFKFRGNASAAGTFTRTTGPPGPNLSVSAADFRITPIETRHHRQKGNPASSGRGYPEETGPEVRDREETTRAGTVRSQSLRRGR
ncbi:hypothetical protein ABH19_04155 [Leptospirillum sp. Group II 'CF-1']|jgi:hypothetical protein|uniref:hypothetical protein n=1 Tax=Leptospirillum sp. Group II 'CF-1' TaxID=1660083 RepID=UPI0002D2FFA4|nr:hypothetical protein [Leptospirillum sp. Group II 'CF-1']AKS23117.1 hypothetical protein ABH19_04155 [Leptospirillum sp. Group II 'CF-1']